MSQLVLIEGLLREIQPHFESAEDVAAIEKIKSVRQQAQLTFDEKQKAIKSIIREISEGVDTQKEQLERAQRGEDEQKALEQAIEERENTLLALQTMEQQGQLLEQQMLEMQAQKRDAEEQLLELRQSKLEEIPLIKHALGLYANITGLRWAYDADTIKGHITKADDVKPFDFGREQNSVQVADKLWNMMG